MQTLRKFAAGVDGLNDKIGVTIRWLTLIMVLIGAAGALVRYFARGLGLSLNLTPLIEAQWYAFSVIFLMGAAYGLSKDVHVRVDVLYSALSKKVRAWIDLVGTVIFLVPFSVLMLYVSWPAVRNSFAVREVSPDPGGLPRYPIKALILVSFALLLLQAVSQLLKHTDTIRGIGDDDAGAESEASAGPGNPARPGDSGSEEAGA